MTIDQSTLTKGQIRKLNALRKSIGDEIAEDAFGKWMMNQSKTPKEVRASVLPFSAGDGVRPTMTVGNSAGIKKKLNILGL